MPELGDLLRDAATAIESERGPDYGPPRINLGERTARLWTAYLRDLGIDRELDGRDVSAMMILVKVARLQEGSGAQRDSWLDIAGYAATGWDCSRDSIDAAPTEGRRRVRAKPDRVRGRAA